MRVANPFHQCGVSSLKLYQALEPETWGKLIGRVNGANFAAIYGGTIALGYRGVSLPKGHTWETYVDFYSRHYQRIFEKFISKSSRVL